LKEKLKEASMKKKVGVKKKSKLALGVFFSDLRKEKKYRIYNEYKKLKEKNEEYIFDLQ
jgi:hypothetical protein